MVQGSLLMQMKRKFTGPLNGLAKPAWIFRQFSAMAIRPNSSAGPCWKQQADSYPVKA